MGQTVGQYELIRRIGRGGMAEVWMGRRASVGGATKAVAIKFMSARVAQDDRHRRMFLAEARLSMLMNHSNVVQVFDAGEEKGRLYLVMEWIDGLNLAQLCELRRRERKPWPPRLSGYIIGEILRGLGYAHHLIHEGKVQCIVHRDISPHNVLVSTSGEVKLADFGVARLAAEETSGMHIKGKLRYMAPEHLAGRSREPTVDLYGAGAVLHELLAGSRFRDEADEVDLYGHILGGRVPALQTSGVPPELVSLREGLLRPEPRQRIPTAERALEYLSAWAGYRNMAVELSQVCRSYMGVTGPRSGFESEARPVDAIADTVDMDHATRTSSRTSGPAAVAVSTAPTELLAVEARPRKGRRAWVWGAAIVGLGFVGGGLGVALWRRDEDEDEDEDEGPDRASSEAAVEESKVTPALPVESVEPKAPAEAPSVSGSSTGATDVASESSSGSTGAESEGDGMSTGAPSVASSQTRPRRARATVEFGLRSPLRSAWVRIGRGETFVVAPKATRTLSPGRHRIYWKGSKDGVWVDGGRFRFESGRVLRLRLTSRGPVAE